MANQNLGNLSLQVSVTCPLCFKVYENHPDKRVNMDNLKHHMLSAKAHPETKISVAQKMRVKTHSKASQQVKAHSVVNNVTETFNCLVCKKVFCMKAKLVQHLNVKHLQQYCSTCKTLFQTEGSMKQHVEAKHPQWKNCLICSKVCKSVEGVQRHSKVKHLHSELHFPQQMCLICSKVFKKEADMKQHMIMKHKSSLTDERKENPNMNVLGSMMEGMTLDDLGPWTLEGMTLEEQYEMEEMLVSLSEDPIISSCVEEIIVIDDYEENTRTKSKTNKASKDVTIFPELPEVVGLDCEMVGVGKAGRRSILARVSIVNQSGHCVYDEFVKPREKVTDYRTAVSGVRPEDLEGASNFWKVQGEVAKIIEGRLVVGHGLHHDFNCLFLDHPKELVRDTASYEPFKAAFGGKTPSLKKLSARYSPEFLPPAPDPDP